MPQHQGVAHLLHLGIAHPLVGHYCSFCSWVVLEEALQLEVVLPLEVQFFVEGIHYCTLWEGLPEEVVQ